jgi:hypothetical protein
MEIFTQCMECQKELGNPSFEPFFVPYYDDRVAYVECSRGHKSALLLQSQKFEVLLESGANALSAGFTLEAAASFSAALERFYEFALKVLLIHREVDPVVYDAMFKEMARQSERQLGAFLALHTLEFNSSYVMEKKITEFRNAVIHKGLIPTPEEARDFCTRVYSEILPLTQRLKSQCQAAIHKVIILDLGARRSSLPPQTPIATSTGAMFFNLAITDCKATFSDAFEAYVEAKTRILRAVPEMKALHAGIMNKQANS